MLVIFLAILAFLMWGSGDIFTTIATRRIGSYSAAFWGYMFGLIPDILLLPFFFQNIFHISAGILILNIFLGLILVISFIAFNEALRIGNPSLVGTIAGAYATLVVLFSVIFFHEHLSRWQLLAMAVTFIGFFFSTLNFSDIKKLHGHFMEKSVYLAALCMLGWGIYFTFIKLPIRQLGWFWPNVISTIVGVLFFLFINRSSVARPSKTHLRGFIAAGCSAIFLTIGTLSFNGAIGSGSSSVAAPIAGSYPVLFVFLSSIIFKERITLQQKIGIGITLAGIVLLSFVSV